MSTELPIVKMTAEQFRSVQRLVDRFSNEDIRLIAVANRGSDEKFTAESVQLVIDFHTDAPVVARFFSNGNGVMLTP